MNKMDFVAATNYQLIITARSCVMDILIGGHYKDFAGLKLEDKNNIIEILGKAQDDLLKKMDVKDE